MSEEIKSFKEYLEKRISDELVDFFIKPAIQKAYFTGAYAQAVIKSSYMSDISKGNETFKNWLSNQVINYANLDRIFEKAFQFEQKLKLKLRNGSEVRVFVHQVPLDNSKGLSNAKITFAFVAGFDDYQKFIADNPIKDKTKKS